MKQQPTYPLFDLTKIRTYPLSARKNRSEISDFADPEKLRQTPIERLSAPWFLNGAKQKQDQSEGLREFAAQIVQCSRQGKPVVIAMGAHPIKNGLSPIIVDLIERGIISLVSGNGAVAIHSFEFALTGASSESVSETLPNGDFGMAFETGAYINHALIVGNEMGYGFGESMGRLICDADFRRGVIDIACAERNGDEEYYKPYDGFEYEKTNIYAAAFKKGIPACVNSMIGTDIIDQHPSFDGAAKGKASGTDFLIFAQEMARLTEGGVILNIGSAVMGPEVVLKAVSMAANIGKAPKGICTGDFDIRPFGFDSKIQDETQAHYYFRDQKSLSTRIPEVFSGDGYYFQGMHENTLTQLYQHIMLELDQ